MILVWFNPNNLSFYTRFYNYYILNDYYVGYSNSYGHFVVNMIILDSNKYYCVSNYYEYCKLKYKKNNKNCLFSFFKRMLIKK